MINVNIDKSNKCNGDYSLYVTFPYDSKIVSTIKEFPSRYYNPDKKEWEVPFNKLGELVEKLSDYEFDITGQYIQVEKKEVAVPEGFQFKTTPYEHQVEGFKYGLNNNKWLLGDEMGLGKTKQVIDIAVAMKLLKGYKHCLIICGVNTLKWNWVNEVKTHSNEDAYILGQRTRGRKTTIGSNKDKLSDLTENFADLPYFIITNIESLRDEEIVRKIEDLTAKNDIGMVAFDECHKAKNPSSQQGKGILKVKADTMIAMTGTPLMNTPLDLYTLLRWLGYEKHSFYQFKNHYCQMGGFGGYEIVGYKHLDELEEQLQNIMLRRKKEEVLDLPDKVFIDEFVEMTAKQEQIYNEVTNDIIANIDQIKMTNNPLAELIRMRQATGYTGILSSSIRESAKLDRMEEIVEEAVENGKKVVIFSNWTQITDEVYKRLHLKYHPAIITGQTDDATRQDEVWHFQNDDKCKVIIGTVGAMGTGITLTAGTVEIFLDEPWNMALKEQAVDRCHRVGTNENITIYTIMAKGTIDERIHELVEKKGAMADALVDGKVVGNKADLLDYLLS